jgi:membrane-bound inhibitor of C-type lysozyme
MIQTRTALGAAAVLSLLSACTRESAEPPAEVPAQPVAPAIIAPIVGYACESGKTVSVQYPDASTAQLTYQNQTYALRSVQSASGARYSGSGVEWWTATRDGQEAATLSRLGPNENIGVAILERCARPSSGTGQPPGPTPSPAPAPGGVLPASAPCKSAQLKLSSEGGDAGMGNRVAVLGVQNIGPQACSITGYPAVTLLDARGRALTTVRSEQTPGNYFRNGQAPTPVNLASQAKAYFDLAWNVVPNEGQGEKTCPSAATVRFTAPGDATALALVQAFTPCGGRIRVSPMRPVPDDSSGSTAPAPAAGP